ncbi:MAG: CAP domain-containing protein [Thermodesulfobacteriota bacterium]
MTYCLRFILLFLFALPVAGVARADEPYDQSRNMEAMLMNRINAARSNPLATAASLGKDPKALLAALPEFGDILNSGLMPLQAQESLSAAAREHTGDMLARNYYSTVSPDGLTHEDRIRFQGFMPLMTGESLGLVAFKNFIEPQKAVDILFKNMFLDELQTGADVERKLLNPHFTHIGIGVQTGSLTIGKTAYNVYLAVCDFGVSGASQVGSLQEAETILAHLINQARTKPVEVAAAMGLNPETILTTRPEWRAALTSGMQALSADETLGWAAQAHTEEMAAHRYFDPNGYDGRSTPDRLKAAGYEPREFAQIIDILALEPETPLAEVSEAVFEQLLFRAFSESGSEARQLFHPALTEMGIGLRPVAPREGEEFRHLYLVTVVFATPAAAGTSRVMGVAYADGNGNNLFDPGEGIPGLPLFVDYPNVKLELATDAVGGLELPLDPGGTRLVIWPGVLNNENWTDGGAGSVWNAWKIGLPVSTDN